MGSDLAPPAPSCRAPGGGILGCRTHRPTMHGQRAVMVTAAAQARGCRLRGAVATTRRAGGMAALTPRVAFAAAALVTAAVLCGGASPTVTAAAAALAESTDDGGNGGGDGSVDPTGHARESQRSAAWHRRYVLHRGAPKHGPGPAYSAKTLAHKRQIAAKAWRHRHPPPPPAAGHWQAGCNETEDPDDPATGNGPMATDSAGRILTAQGGRTGQGGGHGHGGDGGGRASGEGDAALDDSSPRLPSPAAGQGDWLFFAHHKSGTTVQCNAFAIDLIYCPPPFLLRSLACTNAVSHRPPHGLSSFPQLIHA